MLVYILLIVFTHFIYAQTNECTDDIVFQVDDADVARISSGGNMTLKADLKLNNGNTTVGQKLNDFDVKLDVHEVTLGEHATLHAGHQTALDGHGAQLGVLESLNPFGVKYMRFHQGGLPVSYSGSTASVTFTNFFPQIRSANQRVPASGVYGATGDLTITCGETGALGTLQIAKYLFATGIHTSNPEGSSFNVISAYHSGLTEEYWSASGGSPPVLTVVGTTDLKVDYRMTNAGVAGSSTGGYCTIYLTIYPSPAL